MVNLNKLAKEIAEEEGLKVSVNIAQIKEIQRIVIEKLKEMPFTDVIELLRR